MSNNRTIDSSFSPEIWLYLFQFFGPLELVKLTLVNKTFYRLAHHQHLWRELSQQIFPTTYNKHSSKEDVIWYNFFIEEFNKRLSGLNYTFIKLYFYFHQNEANNFDKSLNQLSLIDEPDKNGFSLFENNLFAQKSEIQNLIFQRVLIEYLNEDGILRINHADHCNRNLLHWALYCKQSPEIIKWLLEQGCKYLEEDDYGLQPIHIAVGSGNLAAVKCLIEHAPALLNAPDENERTPIYYAAERNYKEIIVFLVLKGADLNDQVEAKGFFYDGFTALHWAVYHKNIEIVKILLEHDADAALGCGKASLAPIHLACRDGELELLKLFLKKRSRSY